MTERDVEIANRLGLHARAAARFVRIASSYESRIEVVSGDTRVNGKSVLGLLALAAARGRRLRLVAVGDDAEAAITALAALITERFGEQQ